MMQKYFVENLKKEQNLIVTVYNQNINDINERYKKRIQNIFTNKDFIKGITTNNREVLKEIILKKYIKLKKENNVLLLTANTRTQFVDTNKMFNMGQYFTKMMNTWELQMQKSEEKTYKHICKVFNVKPNEIIYIDDQERNLVAPKNLGIQTIFYKNFKQFKKEFDKLYN